MDAGAHGATRGTRTVFENARTLWSQGGLVSRVCQQQMAGRRLVVDGVVHGRTRSPLVRFEDVLTVFGPASIPIDPPGAAAFGRIGRRSGGSRQNEPVRG